MRKVKLREECSMIKIKTLILMKILNDLGKFRFELNESDGFLSITFGFFYGRYKKIKVPASIAGIPVTAIRGLAFSGHVITNVILQEGIRSYGTLSKGAGKLH
jgi:hypothetical protein